jgi:hypothetical protein
LVPKAQIMMCKMLLDLFPSDQVHINYRTKEMLFGASKRMMELDAFIPSLMLGFEYQVSSSLANI